MELLLGGTGSSLDVRTRLLLQRMLCPLSGLAHAIGFARRAASEPRVAVAGGEMTGVHVLRGMPPPPPGAYHIGGSGITYEEAVIRTLGETVERYAQYLTLAGQGQAIVSHAIGDLAALEQRALPPSRGQLFADRQFAQPGFPFAPLDGRTPIGWVEAPSLIDGELCLAPAQQALVGYVAGPEEPRFAAGVTTGSAAHTATEPALRSALLELIQIDAAVGHWYGDRPAVPIEHDERTGPLERLVRRQLPSRGPEVRFYWLPSPDLPGLAVACVLEAPGLPRFAVGLGCDLRLSRAMYKAFLEGAAVAQLAKIILLRQSVEAGDGGSSSNGASPHFYDLDSNVAHYARGGSEALVAKFPRAPSGAAPPLPPDVEADAVEEVRLLVDGFRTSGKELLFLDLTTVDVRDLGFRVVRVWSPDVLTLPLPSAPPLLHARFDDYGGAVHESPHPYP